MPPDLTGKFSWNALETVRVFLLDMKGVIVGVQDQILKADYLLSKDWRFYEQLVFIVFKFLPLNFALAVQQLFC